MWIVNVIGLDFIAMNVLEVFKHSVKLYYRSSPIVQRFCTAPRDIYLLQVYMSVKIAEPNTLVTGVALMQEHGMVYIPKMTIHLSYHIELKPCKMGINQDSRAGQTLP